METRELLRSHSSVRKYTGEQISKETVIDLIETAQMAASSHFVQAYSVIWITDEEKKAKLGELSKNDFQFKTAGASFLFCVDFKRLQVAGQKNGVDIIADSAENLLVGVADVALFAQNFVIAAEAQGYGICYIGGARNNPAEISELFNLPEYVFPLFAITIGTPTKRNETKPRLPVAAVLHENGYNVAQYDTLLDEYDATMESYYTSRSSNQKTATWTKQMADFLVEQKRPFIKEFLASKGFTWK
ncbi:oxygen-insensitive NADPH nitroreductase [Lysinibacillus sp. 2017]|uniref:oxygen-insensitive NADPH nitroreductase n=1 Tax=unclassified Lysinibacillus TaxID=2636778 RepID=UPI000D525A27|nr:MULTISPECIES: oxygen-insensitive NADPH nitroreductase [unclassified Lysinibacillus]AWE06121.1 oxygen-insensitive NADPH nitroreductase [Lysinibacillus sp. 2017]TGN30538.1 oxygen-insensitive NADPH nitroreductase [Lysinibacillus sp. S2017]